MEKDAVLKSKIRRSTNTLCRVCAVKKDFLIPIYSSEGLTYNLGDKINKYLPIEVSETDDYPQHVCYECASTLLCFCDLVEASIGAKKRFDTIATYESSTTPQVTLGNQKSNSSSINLTLSLLAATDRREEDTPKVLHNSDDEADPIDEREEYELVNGTDPFGDECKEIIIEAVADESDNILELNETMAIDAEVKPVQFAHTTPTSKSHKYRKKKPRICKCPVCGRIFRYLDNLKAHMMCHSEKRPFLCHICNATFKRRDHLNNHRRTVHASHPEVLKETGGTVTYPCDMCGVIKSSKQALRVHRKRHTSNLSCDVCPKEFPLPSDVRDHMIKDHVTVECRCPECGELLIGGKSVYFHLKKHKTRYICDICGKRYSYQSSLKTHMVVHSEDKPFTCELCGKSFKLKARLKLHLSSHSESRPYACTKCEDKRFKTRSALITHYNMHNDRRPYPCPYCDFKARKSSDIQSHIRTHTGEKPFECDLCGRGFAQAGDMRKHKITHLKNEEIISTS